MSFLSFLRFCHSLHPPPPRGFVTQIVSPTPHIATSGADKDARSVLRFMTELVLQSYHGFVTWALITFSRIPPFLIIHHKPLGICTLLPRTKGSSGNLFFKIFCIALSSPPSHHGLLCYINRFQFLFPPAQLVHPISLTFPHPHPQGNP
jgi:hypothetical protein